MTLVDQLDKFKIILGKLHTYRYETREEVDCDVATLESLLKHESIGVSYHNVFWTNFLCHLQEISQVLTSENDPEQNRLRPAAQVNTEQITIEIYGLMIDPERDIFPSREIQERLLTTITDAKQQGKNYFFEPLIDLHFFGIGKVAKKLRKMARSHLAWYPNFYEGLLYGSGSLLSPILGRFANLRNRKREAKFSFQANTYLEEKDPHKKRLIEQQLHFPYFKLVAQDSTLAREAHDIFLKTELLIKDAGKNSAALEKLHRLNQYYSVPILYSISKGNFSPHLLQALKTVAKNSSKAPSVLCTHVYRADIYRFFLENKQLFEKQQSFCSKVKPTSKWGYMLGRNMTMGVVLGALALPCISLIKQQYLQYEEAQLYTQRISAIEESIAKSIREQLDTDFTAPAVDERTSNILKGVVNKYFTEYASELREQLPHNVQVLKESYGNYIDIDEIFKTIQKERFTKEIQAYLSIIHEIRNKTPLASQAHLHMKHQTGIEVHGVQEIKHLCHYYNTIQRVVDFFPSIKNYVDEAIFVNRAIPEIILRNVLEQQLNKRVVCVNGSDEAFIHQFAEQVYDKLLTKEEQEKYGSTREKASYNFANILGELYNRYTDNLFFSEEISVDDMNIILKYNLISADKTHFFALAKEPISANYFSFLYENKWYYQDILFFSRRVLVSLNSDVESVFEKKDVNQVLCMLQYAHAHKISQQFRETLGLALPELWIPKGESIITSKQLYQEIIAAYDKHKEGLIHAFKHSSEKITLPAEITKYSQLKESYPELHAVIESYQTPLEKKYANKYATLKQLQLQQELYGVLARFESGEGIEELQRGRLETASIVLQNVSLFPQEQQKKAVNTIVSSFVRDHENILKADRDDSFHYWQKQYMQYIHYQLKDCATAKYLSIFEQTFSQDYNSVLPPEELLKTGHPDAVRHISACLRYQLPFFTKSDLRQITLQYFNLKRSENR